MKAGLSLYEPLEILGRLRRAFPQQVGVHEQEHNRQEVDGWPIALEWMKKMKVMLLHVMFGTDWKTYGCNILGPDWESYG